jgi:glucose/arabinose dehydrogenase
MALLAAALISAGAVATAASAAGPPAPKTYGGAKVTTYATTGLLNVTSFAWGDGQTFAGSSGNSSTLPNGGLFTLSGGKGTRVKTGLLFIAGLAFHNGTLYVSGVTLGAAGPAFQILALSDWSTYLDTFISQKATYTAPKGFDGFNGLAFGPDGRIYVGVDLGLTDGNDHGPVTSKTPYLYDILSMNTSGGALKVFATGIRQPWQMAFAPGSSSPFVSDLGQDTGAKNPPDFLLKVSKGQNYGFPKCNWTKATAKACKKYADPLTKFTPHFDPMGIAIVGKTLYLGSFAGANGKGGSLYSLTLKGTDLKPVVTGLPAETDALAYHDGYLYIGGSTATKVSTGIVFQVKP